jgi:putative SbcD/Mre11-related phosphoesterase
MKFLTNEPALLADRTLVIGDLHIGIEYDFRKSGIYIPSQTGVMASRISRLLKETKARKLVILGDIKHKVPGISWQELREVPEFLSMLGKKVPVEIVPGNHDDGLADIVPNLKIHPSSGFLLGRVYLCHGHSWPSAEFLNADYVVTAHRHPLVEIRDRLGCSWRYPVWVRAGLNKSGIAEKFPEAKGRLPGLVVMPAFNTFAGGLPVNLQKHMRQEKEYVGPLIRSAEMKKAKLYLLDGTYLGSAGSI